ncbi:hypothetical protein KAR91_77890 [Candidatus Pacearchaeota archaeon]|nr:hypothetical protein [Candidatus Pacearchaeota archaeon]
MRYWHNCIILFLILFLFYSNGAHAINLTGADSTHPSAILENIDDSLTSIDGKIPADPSTVTEQDQTQALIGEVQASPTENTVLDRLKDINTVQSDGTQTAKLVNDSNVAYADDIFLTACMGGQQVALSRISYIDKFGRNPDIDTGTDPEDIWDAGGLWVPPTAARTHAFVSSSGEDDGSVLSTGTADTGSSTTILYDAAADFVTDAVAAGDAVLNDTNIDHSIVVSVDDLNTLTLETSHHANFTTQQSSTVGFNSGDTYRIVSADGAATGATIIHLYGLDSNFDEAEEFVVLNGAGSVNTIRTYWRIYKMHIDGAVSRTANNVGIITATAAVDGTVTAQINATNGQTLMAIYTIPNGKTGCMVHFSSTIFKGAVGALSNSTLRQTKFAGPDGAGSIIEHYFGMATDGNSHVHHPYGPYKRFEEKTDIFMRADTVTANDTEVTGAFDIILVDN